MRVGFTLCRAWLFGANRSSKSKKQSVHVCGREGQHTGLHQCYCGERWHRNKKQKLCGYWSPDKPFAGIPGAQPGGQVSDSEILELFGRRKMDL